ncbi:MULTISPECIES: helix-turn-helix domain-containing protein [Clostridia]|jgi:transcriptional regulator with XRE-family HTH domain|uniref:Helix-turn-helix transcriptional regulator n=1 Tax=Jutongia huaianensis TaxID=2763668 RepID=A0ABR7N196_9FIRM|nr:MULTISPECIES: helix-turn-helix transcriptional regulator [Clostridia]RHU96173.1 XRE family transcriptional regulator [Clostridium sp. OM07-9AC]RHV05541.1 XRE family transcriptional regulator [Clostridium sp. OM07-10AC]HCS15230.1 XRE family transcriptional regulator [Lachnospiraceae bacterium]MBC8562100.1 helix-turn-helix transcriptional regulator [Jutongia huaianensis]RHQ09446.1 XRE family transcriptional regulator [Clostridium sp. AM49-4BH]
MALNPKQFGTVMKNARMDKKLTQAELAEILDLSLSYLKDLERFKNTPSLEVFAKTIQYFNLSADTVIYPDKNLNNSTYQKLQRHLLQCDEKQLKTLLAIAEAVLSVDDTRTDNSDI